MPKEYKIEFHGFKMVDEKPKYIGTFETFQKFESEDQRIQALITFAAQNSRFRDMVELREIWDNVPTNIIVCPKAKLELSWNLTWVISHMTEIP